MAALDRQPGRPLSRQIVDRYGRFDVHQLVRLLSWRTGQAEGMSPADAIGDSVRFRADLSAAFPGHEVTRLVSRRSRKLVTAKDEPAEIVELTTPNYCIASVLGPLPSPFTEWIRDQERAGNRLGTEFLNLFNHRLNLLRHQIKARQDLAVNILPPERAPQADCLAAIAGIRLQRMQAQVPLPRRAWLGLAGLLADCRKSAAAVSRVLRLYLGRPVALTPLVGAWRPIEPCDRQGLCRPGAKLGVGTLLGRRIWDQQARVRLTVAPMPYRDFSALLPALSGKMESRAAGLAGLVRLLLDRRCDCEVELAVDTATLPVSSLARPRPDIDPAGGYAGLRLGLSAWIGEPAKGQDRTGDAGRARSIRYLVPAFATGDAP